jgi:hypothetical protein
LKNFKAQQSAKEKLKKFGIDREKKAGDVLLSGKSFLE